MSESLPTPTARLRDLLTRWELTQDGPVRQGSTSLVVPVRTVDARAVVLKVSDGDPTGEIAALKAWRGAGAVELFRAAPALHGLLLERLPGAPLAGMDARTVGEAIGGLMRVLHRPAVPQLRPVASVVEPALERVAALSPDVAPPRLVRQAVELGRDLLTSAPAPVVLHGDLHAGHVLVGHDEEWVAIAPVGWVGDPAYDVAPTVWQDPWPTERVSFALSDRFWNVVDPSGVDGQRARYWTLVRSMINLAERPDDHDHATAMITTAKIIGALDDGPAW